MSITWQQAMYNGVAAMLEQCMGYSYERDAEIMENTPYRVVRAFQELTNGCDRDAAEVLGTMFPEKSYDQIITINDIDFSSLCEHHLLPFFGVVHFAYLPDNHIVGLSKVPRMVEILAHRPQVQERLTALVADTFQEKVQPKGCGVVIEAWHACASIRGVRKPNMRMKTVALRGIFRNPDVKSEFLSSVNGKR